METELQDKHQAKRKMETAIRKFVFEFRRTFNNIIFNAINYHLTVVNKSQTKARNSVMRRS